MNIVDTPSPKRERFVLRPDGTIDFDKYIGLLASFPVGKILVTVEIVGARTRYGHLDLNIKPVTGSGTRWVEYKNLMIHNDPINGAEASVPLASLTVEVPPILAFEDRADSIIKSILKEQPV